MVGYGCIREANEHGCRINQEPCDIPSHQEAEDVQGIGFRL